MREGEKKIQSSLCTSMGPLATEFWWGWLTRFRIHRLLLIISDSLLLSGTQPSSPKAWCVMKSNHSSEAFLSVLNTSSLSIHILVFTDSTASNSMNITLKVTLLQLRHRDHHDKVHCKHYTEKLKLLSNASSESQQSPGENYLA